MTELAEPFSLDKCEAVEQRSFDFDKFEAVLAAAFEPVELPLIHRFTPHLYIREILMPAGSVVTSVIHALEHPFVVSMGKASIYTEGGGIEHIEAPYTGITKPGTRRLLLIHEDMIFTTFHVTEETDPAVIREQVTIAHVNPYLGMSIEELIPMLKERTL